MMVVEYAACWRGDPFFRRTPKLKCGRSHNSQVRVICSLMLSAVTNDRRRSLCESDP